MQKLPTLLLFFTSLLSLNACKKDDTPSPNANRVKTYTVWDSFSVFIPPTVVTYDLSYDANGRVASLISTSSPGDRTEYSYPSANHFSKDVFISNVLFSHEDDFTNSNRLLDSVFQYQVTWTIEFNTYDTIVTKYLYDASNKSTGYKGFRYSLVYGIKPQYAANTVYNADGDLLHAESGPGFKDTFDYEYYTGLDYIPPIISGLPGVSKGGKKHLVKRAILNSFGGGGPGYIDHIYTFDSSNRIVSEKIVGSGDTEIITYTYF
ncbi:hypothetical protein QWZ08_15530 [Ferruginibacter paludis]|uniref:hypothetical protein n=1 Tax=Ferruginibacter paludis TaxID=1310417 RepID=UPI0025B44B68|nr:hypothetical protein [Ferruginibacter paludis]MDN3657060.1 hypothetical protein [Ferruginibacter paludis]